MRFISKLLISAVLILAASALTPRVTTHDATIWMIEGMLFIIFADLVDAVL